MSFLSAKEALTRYYGEILEATESTHFSHSSYYSEEMGENLLRCFIGFKDFISPSKLASIKKNTNLLEESFSIDNKRTINIDPGYLDLPKVVLASTKDFSHRIYLGEEIFAEVTLHWRQKRGFVDLPWTYPDYKSVYAKEFFGKLRDYYVSTLKKKEAYV